MPDVVVVDASLAAMWVIPESYSLKALVLAERWATERTRVLAPCLVLPEVTNVLYKRVTRKELTLDTAQRALDIVLEFDIEVREEPGLSHRVMEWAQRLKQPTAYDGHYLALAEHLGCELWTGDRRLYESARREVPWVRWIGKMET
jgi:predicted nucleic acid-binding protein